MLISVWSAGGGTKYSSTQRKIAFNNEGEKAQVFALFLFFVIPFLLIYVHNQE